MHVIIKRVLAIAPTNTTPAHRVQLECDAEALLALQAFADLINSGAGYDACMHAAAEGSAPTVPQQLAAAQHVEALARFMHLTGVPRRAAIADLADFAMHARETASRAQGATP